MAQPVLFYTSWLSLIRTGYLICFYLYTLSASCNPPPPSFPFLCCYWFSQCHWFPARRFIYSLIYHEYVRDRPVLLLKIKGEEVQIFLREDAVMRTHKITIHVQNGQECHPGKTECSNHIIVADEVLPGDCKLKVTIVSVLFSLVFIVTTVKSASLILDSFKSHLVMNNLRKGVLVCSDSACLHWVILEMILHISSEACDRLAPNYICKSRDPHESTGR